MSLERSAVQIDVFLAAATAWWTTRAVRSAATVYSLQTAANQRWATLYKKMPLDWTDPRRRIHLTPPCTHPTHPTFPVEQWRHYGVRTR